MGLLDVRNSIIASLEQGVTRQELFTHQVEKHPAEAPRIAFAIASVPQRELRKKYMMHNGALFISLVGVGILSLLAELPIDFTKSTIFIFLRIVIPLLLSYFVYHFHGGIYRLLGVWCVFDLIEMLVLGKYITVVGLLRLILVFLATILSFLIARRVFFNLRFLGPKQDNQGRYLL